jgi:hypothetical protein
MKLAIIGSRSFNDSTSFDRIMVDFLVDKTYPSVIVSGNAPGADTLAEEWALTKGIETRIFKPQYKDFPKKERNYRATKERNTQIANFCEMLIAFWDMNSTGTRDTIEKTIGLGKPVYIHNVNSGETKMVSNREDLPLLDKILFKRYFIK